MTARTTASPSSAMIRATFDMMLREWRHRPTAVRFTCADLGIPKETVLGVIEPAGVAPRRSLPFARPAMRALSH